MIVIRPTLINLKILWEDLSYAKKEEAFQREAANPDMAEAYRCYTRGDSQGCATGSS
jgi:hypothetical protein